jgi:methylated-DNA-protein-cysteine methyltransferase related protein
MRAIIGTMSELLQELWAVVSQIPPGRCASYGDVGAALRSPASGRMVGRWMAQCPDDVPWWRVVARDGRLPISKRDPRLMELQAQRLREEGVEVREGAVEMEKVGWPAEALGGR